MSVSLDHVAETHRQRLILWNQMLDHLDIDPGADLALKVQGELRLSLLACAQCHATTRCADWLSSQRAGPPPYCDAYHGFKALEAALDRRADAKDAAPR